MFIVDKDDTGYILQESWDLFVYESIQDILPQDKWIILLPSNHIDSLESFERIKEELNRKAIRLPICGGAIYNDCSGIRYLVEHYGVTKEEFQQFINTFISSKVLINIKLRKDLLIDIESNINQDNLYLTILTNKRITRSYIEKYWINENLFKRAILGEIILMNRLYIKQKRIGSIMIQFN